MTLQSLIEAARKELEKRTDNEDGDIVVVNGWEELDDFLAHQMRESYLAGAQDIIKAVSLEFDHKKCPLPLTCAGYESAMDDVTNRAGLFLESLSSNPPPRQ